MKHVFVSGPWRRTGGSAGIVWGEYRYLRTVHCEDERRYGMAGISGYYPRFREAPASLRTRFHLHYRRSPRLRAQEIT